MSRIAGVLLALVAIAGLAVLKYVTGDIVRWGDAYDDLESAETAHPLRGKDGERIRLANAMVESEPPRGMPIERRLHPVGTLAHLRYETLDREGAVVSTLEVRSLVPSLPAFGVDAPAAPSGQTACPRRCAEELAKSGGTQIARGGSPGLSPEWVLRMPVGQAFDLGRQSFTLQDLEDPRPISLAQARYRVTLLEACPARVRTGTVTTLEVHENAIIPVPRGFRTHRWVQVDDCAALLKKRPARPEAVPAPATVAKETPAYAYAPPKLELLVPRRDTPDGWASLVVDEGVMLLRAQAMHVAFRRICRYDPASNRWEPLPPPQAALEIEGPPRMNVTRVAYRFPEAPGLYWAEWSEMPGGDRGAARAFALVVAGGSSVRCNEGDLPAPGPAEISLCVPRHGPALPGTVPDPVPGCPLKAPGTPPR
jgi:hypothetical protein